jgi:polyisoprenoid-binding protein YceI
MRLQTFALICVTATTLTLTAGAAEAPLALSAARVWLEGTSNIHAYTASTTTVNVTAIEIVGGPTEDVLAHVLQPAGLKTFDVTIPAASLVSEKGDLNKNMHKALKVQEHPNIRFRLGAVEESGNAYRATGWLTVAGVEKQVALALQLERKGNGLAVTGTTDLLMTDYGITPPKAMLGMLKTNPKVQIRLELLLGVPVKS